MGPDAERGWAASGFRPVGADRPVLPEGPSWARPGHIARGPAGQAGQEARGPRRQSRCFSFVHLCILGDEVPGLPSRKLGNSRPYLF